MKTRQAWTLGRGTILLLAAFSLSLYLPFGGISAVYDDERVTRNTWYTYNWFLPVPKGRVISAMRCA